MKKFILPLMLLLLVGSILAVESAPSAVVGYVKYDCVAGDNMIALPMESDFAFASEVGEAIGASTIGYFDPTIPDWVLIDEYPWGGWTDEFAVANGDPLIIYNEDAMVFYSIGNLPATIPGYDLVAGDNVIMHPLNKGALDLGSLIGEDIGATSIGYFDNTIPDWVLIDEYPWGGWTDEFDTSIGKPLFLYTDNAGTWPSRARNNNIDSNSKIGAKK
ncbi:MAG: hypothetical protein RBQ87_10470 [Candidatus Cloacimonadaceae bacterium]|nr:hypothetical protein [Candidatus Cloacimonadota bacterium]MDY0326569.1 hypothetical protein [Candidatus Cloacimonadaceae bacterium]